jgi:hypothetical protein
MLLPVQNGTETMRADDARTRAACIQPASGNALRR